MADDKKIKLNSKPFKADKEKYYRIAYGTAIPSFREKLRIWIFHFGFQCVIVYRLGRFASRIYAKNKLLGLPLKLVHFVLDYFIKAVYHVTIDADIGPGLYVGHIGNIYIGPTKIGSNFSVTHNVTIGVGHSGGKEGIPVIGDNVWIGTGSVISGAIRIGDNVTISTGCILTRDIPEGCLAAGNPGRVLMNNYDNRHLFGYPPSGPSENKKTGSEKPIETPEQRNLFSK